jgi:PAS domain S-box-containing protein
MTKPFLKPYALATLSVGGAALASWLLHPLVHEENLMLFLDAVVITAMFGSMRAALLATLLSVLVGDYLFDHATLRLGLDLKDAERAFVFTLVAATVSRLSSTRKLMLANAELQAIFDHIPVMLAFVGEDGRLKLVNREWERTLGWSLEEVRSRDLDIFAECYPDPEYRRCVLDFIEMGNATWGDFKTKTRDGRTIDTL